MACVLPLRASSSFAHVAHILSYRLAPLSIPVARHTLHLSTLTQKVPRAETPPIVIPDECHSPPPLLAQDAGASPSKLAAEKPRPRLRASKAAITLTPEAVSRLRALVTGPTPQLIRIGVRNKGCAGMSYHLEYVEKPGKFDEVVEQEGVKVLIDSKALFSIIGSEMDWKEDKLSSKFAFKNPNIKDACGCGESFVV